MLDQLAATNQGVPTRAGYATNFPAIFADGENRKAQKAQEGSEVEGIRGPREAVQLADSGDFVADLPNHSSIMHLRLEEVKSAV